MGWPPPLSERVGLEIYRALLWPAAPLVAAWLGIDPTRRPQLRRFQPDVPQVHAPIWVHACSVGEVNTALPLVRAIQQRWPDRDIVLTASTPTGHAFARDRSPVPVAWFPLDHPLSVNGFFERLQPSALLLVETELWPGVLSRAHRLGVPVALISGRLSDAHARAYARSRRLWQAVLRPLAAAAMQSQLHADRIAALGVPPDRIRVTGNIKYDALPEKLSPAERERLRSSLGIAPDAPVVVFGSTHPGDEALAADCWRGLRGRFPGLRLIVAPRHLDRVEAAGRELGAVPHVRRSTISGASDRDAGVILLDTHGELGRVYAIADVAVMGGSLHPGVDGHNPLEPAAQGVVTIVGPHMRNFRDITAQLLECGSAVQIPGPGSLCAAIGPMLDDRAATAQRGASALEVLAANRGAIERTLAFIAPAAGLTKSAE